MLFAIHMSFSFATILPPEPKDFGSYLSKEILLRESLGTECQTLILCLLIAFGVWNAVYFMLHLRISAGNAYFSFATILPPEPKHFGFPHYGLKCLPGAPTNPNIGM